MVFKSAFHASVVSMWASSMMNTFLRPSTGINLTVQFYPGKHPCEKPADMLQQIISASSRPGDVVADFFAGSGSTLKQAALLGRSGIGVELETERFEQTVSEIRNLLEHLPPQPNPLP